MPDSDGRIKGISVPCIPWHNDAHKDVENPYLPQEYIDSFDEWMQAQNRDNRRPSAYEEH